MSLLYLLSSLPMLSFDGVPGLSADTFAESCREQLSAADASAAEALLHGLPSEHPFVAALLDKEAILRNAVAGERARITGKDSAQWERPTLGCDLQIRSEVGDAFLESDPLSREKALDKARWRIAEELQGPDPLTVKAVFAYAVKLRIVTRWAGLHAEQGRQAFESLTQVPITLNPDT
jgi:hypothetical protein